MTQLKHKLTLGAVLACAAFAAAPAVAAAESLWVAQTATVSGNGKSCTQPGYTHIQEALNKAGSGATIHVCTGTYEEQLEVAKSVKLLATGSATVKLPTTPANSTGACSAALASNTQDVVEVCGAITVKIKALNVQGGWPAGTCNNNLYDILVGDGANLKLSDASVTDAGDMPINGCQGGVGIQVGTGRTTPAEQGTASLSHVTVTGYQKNGIDVDGGGSTAKILDATVTGAGPTEVIAQNGIQVSRGAVVKIIKSSVTKNQYQGAASACGVIFFEAATGSSIKSSKISEDDIGVDYEESATSKLTVTGDEFITDRYVGVFITEGEVIVNKSKFNGGEDGIELYSYEGETNGPTGTGSGDTIENMSEYAVAGFTNNGPAGSFTITKSKISGNPGPTPESSVHSEPPVIITTTASDS